MSKVAIALAENQQWEHAEEVASSIADISRRAKALRNRTFSLDGPRWEQAEETIHLMEPIYTRARTLNHIAEHMIRFNEHEKLLCLVQHSWLQAEKRRYALQIFSLALDLISLKPEIGIAFYEAFTWVETFLSR